MNYGQLAISTTVSGRVLTAVELAVVFKVCDDVGDEAPEEVLSVAFMIEVGWNGVEEMAEVITAGFSAENEVGEKTGVSLGVSVVAADWLLTGAADSLAGAEAAGAVATGDGTVDVRAAEEVCEGAAEDTAPVLPASGTSSCLPASGSASRPHFSPALLSVPP